MGNKKPKYMYKIGKQKKDLMFVDATTFTGKHGVRVYTPKKPTPKERKETERFLMGELDDHKALAEYKKPISLDDTPTNSTPYIGKSL